MPGPVITQWTGEVDGDYSDDNNWTNDVPIDGLGDVYFTTGSVDCNENLPVTADGIDYMQLTIGPKYTGTIGSSTVPLELVEVETVFYAQKTGQVFLHASITDTLIVESTLQATRPWHLWLMSPVERLPSSMELHILLGATGRF